MIKIGPGEHYVTTQPDELIVTVLGSCVAACIRDPLAGIGGMNHFMLPESASGNWGQASANMRYGNFAMERLINDILSGGGRRSRLEVKVFGGAAMIANGATVGHQNASFVESYLRAERMPIAAHHLRGDSARRVDYAPRDGKVMMLEMMTDRTQMDEAESRFMNSMQRRPAYGSIELFD